VRHVRCNRWLYDSFSSVFSKIFPERFFDEISVLASPLMLKVANKLWSVCNGSDCSMMMPDVDITVGSPMHLTLKVALNTLKKLLLVSII